MNIIDQTRYLVSWEKEARGILKAELARRGISYAALAQRLQDIQVEETERSIANKMSRGTFSFVFFLQCLAALGLEEATISVPLAKWSNDSGATQRSPE